MIHVERGDAPDDFVRYAADYWEEFMGKSPRPSAWTKARKRKKMRDYARILFNAFQGKCALCESKMVHVSPAHIEHYRPKGDKRFVHLMFRWDNWLLSCSVCNTSKGDRFPECEGLPCLIDPTREEPSEHLEFVGVQAASKTVRGDETVRLVNLSRSELEDQRRTWLLLVDALLLLLKYLAICFQVFAYEEQLSHCEPQMNADERRRPVCRTHPRSSAVCESCFPRKNPGKLYLNFFNKPDRGFNIKFVRQ